MDKTTSLGPEEARLLLTTEETAVGSAASSIGIRPGLAQGSLGAGHIIFMVMAAIAPAGGAVAILPLAIALGVGVGTPGMFLVVGIGLMLFAIGFTRMVPYIRNAGAFFAYVTAGIGRPAGLAAALVALTSYLAIASGTVGALGFFANISMDHFFGVSLPWWFYSLVALAIAFVLGYLRITLAAGVLAVALIAEAMVVLVLDVAILVQSGLGAFSFDSFSPQHVFSGGVVGVGVIYAFTCFQGFEGTAIYAEEARDPVRTVPRATYGAIGCICLFFVLTAWALIVGAGGAKAPGTALADPGNFTYQLSTTFVGSAWTDIFQVLIVTSCFAGVLAFHNAASRYFFALARDGFMPRRLATVHPRYSSPVSAGLVSIGVMMLVVSGFAIGHLDPLTTLSSSMSGFGAVGLLTLATATSAAVCVFFWRRGQRSAFHIVAPGIATLGLGTATFFALKNYESITGTSSTAVNSLPWIHLATIIIAVILALVARRLRPAAYAQMGQAPVDV